MKLIECVPNFSEGKNKDIIDSITSEISSVSDVKLLDVDPGKDTNRTVVTFVGEPESVIEAAFLAISKASELIDMSSHKGAHPRMGATDVCPLIPIKGVTVDECIAYSHKLAQKVAKKLSIPIFMYEKSAKSKERQNLANIRKGEYEGMEKKIQSKNWAPDYGKKFNIKSGVTAIGVREFLIAYNINLNTSDKKLASDIALDIREAGRAKRDKKGKIVRDKNNVIIKVPGSLKSVKGVGWYLEEHNIAQVSMNLVDYKTTSIHKTFEEVRGQAQKRGMRVTGSELVGLIPMDALLDAGRYFLTKQNKSTGVSNSQLIHIAVKSLGLDEMYPFNKNEKIIEYLIDTDEKLVNKTIVDFVDEVSMDSPAPGGGSVSAVAASMSVGLVSMVANLSFNKKEFYKKRKKINKLADRAQQLKNDFLNLVDLDTLAFNDLMNAFRLPKKTDKEIQFRTEQILSMTKLVTEIPLRTLEKTEEAIDLALEVLKIGNVNCVSDVGVASEMAYSSAYGAYYNVRINLLDLKKEKSYSNQINHKIIAIISNMDNKISKIRDLVEKDLSCE
ncbi:glutamate formimidoyltransferase [bacterium]|nr:glutamate formimidoyltransferase [bacterium]